MLRFQGHLGQAFFPQSTDPTDYTYGSDHSLLEGQYAAAALTHNRFQAFGSASVAERFAWPELAQVYERLLQVHDLNLDTQTKLEERGDALVLQANLGMPQGEVTIPVNCGQELYDVVEVTDAGAGLSNASYRVRGLHLMYRRQGRPAYQQRLSLSRV